MSLVKFEKKKHWQWFIFFIAMYTFMVYMVFFGAINLFYFGVLAIPIQVTTTPGRDAVLVCVIPIAVAIALMIFKKHNYGVKIFR